MDGHQWRFDPAGCNAEKKIKGKRRHILVDTTSPTLDAVAHAAHTRARTAANWS